jgi:diaminopimelate epimerase
MELPGSVRFCKLSAGGNDFICLDNTTGEYEALLSSPALACFVRALCRRGLAVGADGVIFACPKGRSRSAAIRARFLEPDGSEAELCGNGAACFTYWVTDKRLVRDRHLAILTAAGVAHGCRLRSERGDATRVRVCVPVPRVLELGVLVEAKGRVWALDHIVTGTPHAVAFVQNLQALDVAHWGPGIRHHPHFQPRGVNANFVQVLGVGQLAVRTFEFGVEAETLACGTGSAAAAIAACLREDWPRPYRTWARPVLVQTRGGETLRVRFTICGRRVTDVCLETRVRAVYEGTLRPEFVRAIPVVGGAGTAALR